MAIVAGFDMHRRQITFDALDTESGEVSGRSMPWSSSVSYRLAGERDTYVETAAMIADHAGLTGCPKEPAQWPHERDPRLSHRA